MLLMTFRIRSAVASSSFACAYRRVADDGHAGRYGFAVGEVGETFLYRMGELWPRLSLRRSPRSRWSCSTIAVFTRMERMMSSRSRGASERISSKECLSTMEKSLRVADDARLYYLGQTRPELPVGEAGEQLGVAEDEFRLVEDSDDVLVSVEVHAVFAADARIDLCEEGSGQESETDAPHVGGGDKTGDVGHDAAAHTDDEGAPVGPPCGGAWR